MKNVRSTLALIVLTMACGSLAQALESSSGLFVEPGLTFGRGDTSANYPDPLTSSTGTADGLGLSARLGFHFSEAFFFGLDGRYSRPQFKDSRVSYDASAVASNWGPVIGMQMPQFGLRVWAVAVTGGDLDPEASGSFDVKFKKAAGYRVGAGWHLAAFSVNLEYEDLKYDQTLLESVGSLPSGMTFDSVTLKDRKWIVSVSFPLSF